MHKKMFGDAPVGFVMVMFLFAVAAFSVSFWQFTITAYEGKMLVSHTDYETFKASAINPDFTIAKLQVMNSEPVYLDFKVVTPRSASFPMGDNIEWQYNVLGLLISIIGLFLLSIPFWAFKIK